MAQSTDVIFVILILRNTSNAFTDRHYGISLKIVIKSTPREKYRKIMTIKIWLWSSVKMFKVKELMFACKVYLMGGHLWLYYSEYDKEVDIELHAQVSASS